MEKKPITPFLKVMSILTLIESILAVVINMLAVFLAPVAEEVAGEPLDGMIWVNLAVSIICAVANIVIAIMALQHKKIELVYKISIFTFIAPIVFSSTQASGLSGYVSLIGSAVIPALFLAAAFKQNKLDQAQ